MIQPGSPASLLSVQDLVVGYHRQGILPPVNFVVRPGELWLLAGRNGAGKSTLLRTLLGLLAPVSGRIERAGEHAVAYLSQKHRHDPLLPMRAIDVVAQGIESGWSFLQPWRGRSQRDRLQAALHRAGAGALAYERFSTLSEGQRQRVLLAQAIVSGASLLVLDEPTAAMDMRAEAEALDCIDALRREAGTAIIMVSHDLAEGMRRADRMVVVDAEHQRVIVGPVGDVSADPIFRRHFALPVAAGADERSQGN